MTWQAAQEPAQHPQTVRVQAYGLPVVGSDLPSARPFIHDGVNGYRVRADDPAAHAAAILALLRDPGYAARLGRARRILVQERWNWQEMESGCCGWWRVDFREWKISESPTGNDG